MKYKITKKPKGWIVVNDKGYIANNHYHKTEKEAKKHKELLDAFCGEDKT